MSKLHEEKLHTLIFLNRQTAMKFRFFIEGLQGVEWSECGQSASLTSGAINVARRWILDVGEADFIRFGGKLPLTDTIWRMLGSWSPPQLDYENAQDFAI